MSRFSRALLGVGHLLARPSALMALGFLAGAPALLPGLISAGGTRDPLLAAAGTVGDFLVESVRPTPALPPDLAVDTGFDPRLDGIAFANDGHTLAGGDGNGGDCAGMSTISALWYSRWRRVGGSRLRSVFPGDSPLLHDLAVLAQHQQRHGENGLEDASPGGGGLETGLRLIEAMRETGEPQLFRFRYRDPETGASGGHRIVVTAYRDGSFLAYDPNIPDELIRIEFGRRGFGRFLRADGTPIQGVYAQFTRVGTISLAEIGGDAELARLELETRRAPFANPNDVAVSQALTTPRSIIVMGRVANYRSEDRRTVELTMDGELLPVAVGVSPEGEFKAIVDPVHLLHRPRAPGELVQVHVVTRDDDGSYAGGATLPAFRLQPTSRGFVARLAHERR